MGNALSGNQKQKGRRQQKNQQQAWGWEFKDGRAQIKPRAAAPSKQRPLFKKQPSDNYDLWIFNPDKPKRSGSSARRR